MVFTRLGQLANALVPNSSPSTAGTHRWAVTGMRRVEVRRITTQFDGADEARSASFAVGMLELALEMEVTGL